MTEQVMETTLTLIVNSVMDTDLEAVPNRRTTNGWRAALFVILATPILAAAASPKPILNQALRTSLVAMGEADQSESIAAAKGKPIEGASAHYWQRITWLKQIIAEYGWPGRSLVGDDGETAAWLIAQHADDEPAFQQSCLALVEAAFAAGEVPGMHLAYLSDRVDIAFGRRQRYGTQGSPVYSNMERDEVNTRRAKLGMSSMAEMAKQRGEMYQAMYANPRPSSAKGSVAQKPPPSSR